MPAPGAAKAPSFTLRRAAPEDAPAAREVRADSIRTLGPSPYSPEQVEAWISGDRPVERYAEQIRDGTILKTLAIESGTGTVLGWSGYSLDKKDDTHRIVLYVRGSDARRGVGRALFQEAEHMARAAKAEALHCDSSIPTVPFYKSMGMEAVQKALHALPCGTPLPRVQMRKAL